MKSLVVLNECMFSKKQKDFLKNNFSQVAIYNNTLTEEQAIKRIGDRNIAILDQFMFTFSEKLLQNCRNLELVVVNTTAYDAINLKLLNKYNIKLAHLEEYATQDVAETAFAMIFALNNRLQIAQKYAQKENIVDFYPGFYGFQSIVRKQLKKQTIGIVGLGRIGQTCAEIAINLGIKVVGFNRSSKIIDRVELVSLENLFKKSDIIVIALSYEKQIMNNFISEKLLNLAKNDTILVSISHPNLINIEYLIKNPKKFAGIGFDYLITPEVKKLVKTRKENTIITPHLGSQSYEAIERMTGSIIEAALSFSKGRALYLVN